jgi:hypothetical protein
MKATKITLEDCGQDFLVFYVDSVGKIIEAAPFQSSVWVGATIPIWSDEIVKPGELCPIHKPPHLMFSFLKYKIESVEEVEYDDKKLIPTE